MTCQRSLLVLLGGLALAPHAAAAQEGGVYIPQIDPATPATNQRRSTAPSASDRVLQNASRPTTPSPTAAPGNLGVDLTALNGNPTLVRSAVTAASLGGSGAGALTDNVAVINQFGAGNISAVNQSGTNNSATATLTGNNNTTAQNQSGGSGNRSSISATGDNNNLSSNQVGSNNSYNVAVTGSGFTVNTTQQGTGLSYGLTSDAMGVGGKVITVTQTGVGAGVNAQALPLPASNILAIPSVK